MAIDTGVIGTELPPSTFVISRDRLRFFAKAIGETDPVYTDVDAAKQAGYKDIPTPPTFLFAVELEHPDPFAFLTEIGVDLRFVLHGEQSFSYHDIAYPGDTLLARPRITDVYSKKGGALEFIVKDTAITRSDGTPVADLRAVTVVQNPGVSS
ncbi:MAG: MaoC family dehydratase N-terminal domain-containing protein [Mycolicibacterium fortuitum]|uniref:MaoC family dehydratase N-terminal domain-containing protein n=1 Tax=Mycolicibacterium fortuitum TaxID=1766 RepID=UPI0022BA4204|nr:MaoC family dehydratase N-terminal domain-containing protein [Mycolicibacterium fortuitum]WAY19759.1 MaoC family dehydratase N-terminal domain-containing protein [Mycolicibacterium fortuitum]